MVCQEGYNVIIGVKKKSTAMHSVDYSAEICPVGGGRKKTLDSWNGKNYS